jgi:uncharacterized oligopeptide transporter (OPT) family protein
MNFSLGFFVGGQVLAGMLGSTVTLGYGAQGKHGANYMQTGRRLGRRHERDGRADPGDGLARAAAAAGLAAGALHAAIGMFGAGSACCTRRSWSTGCRLPFPSGLAVANILRALTDPVLLRRAVGTLGIGMGVGLGSGIASAQGAILGAIELSASTFGAGMLVGARIGIPAVVAGVLGRRAGAVLRLDRLAAEGDPPRKIIFLIALGTIMGAAHHRPRR